MCDLSSFLQLEDKHSQLEAIERIRERIKTDPDFIHTINQNEILNGKLSDFSCNLAAIFHVVIPQERFDEFWCSFLKDGIHPQNYAQGLDIISYYFEHYHFIKNIDSMDQVFSILFYRIEKTVVEYNFEEINQSVIKTLAAVAPIAPLRCFLSPSLFDSITSIFMNHDDTFESSVIFLSRFFHRKDAKEALYQLVLNLIIVLSNYSPPKHSLWRFLCFFFANFSETIEEMCDFDALEKGGVLPIFTRSLIWTIRLVIQHPPETEDEPLFWDFCKDVLTRYINAKDQKAQVRRLYDHIFNELRLAICCGIKSAISNDWKLINKTALDVFKLLITVNENEMIESFNLLFGEILEVTLSFCLISENQKVIDAAKDFATTNQIKIKEIIL